MGRKLVEEGQYCKRSNLNQVDPNRNWSESWEKNEKKRKSDEYSGDYPFSEVESAFTKDKVTTFLPDVFLTLHSGVFGLFYPYGSKLEEGKRNITKIKKVLNSVKNLFCNYCSVSTPSLFLKYISHGNGLDYVYDKLDVSYSFAWEIYTNEIDYKEYIKKEDIKSNKSDNKRPNSNSIMNNINFAQKNIHKKIDPEGSVDSYYKNMFSSFLQTDLKVETNTLQSRNSYKINNHDIFCLNLFNPNSEEDYTYIIQSWTKSLLYTFRTVYEWEKENKPVN